MLRERASYYETEARYAPCEQAAEAREKAARLRQLADRLERGGVDVSR